MEFLPAGNPPAHECFDINKIREIRDLVEAAALLRFM